MKLDHLGMVVKDIHEASWFYQNSLGWKESSEIILDPVKR